MKRLTIAQPFLFAIFPLLSLLGSNLDFVRPAEILLPLAIVAGATALLFALGAWLLRDIEAAAITLSVFWFLFFSYGRLLRLLGGAGAMREVLLVAVCLSLLSLTIAFVVRRRGRLQPIAGIVTIVGLALVAMPLVSMAPALLARPAARPDLTAALPTLPPPSPTAQPAPLPAAGATLAPTPTAVVERPDIYYIILDGYARSDVLADVYGYDNSGFLAGLARRGFYIAGRSRANYMQTYLSLTSSLNMTYLDEVAAIVGEESDDRRPLQELLEQNAVARLLKDMGYTYVAVSTGYAEGELAAADVFLSAGWSLSQFESGILNATPLSPLIEAQHEMHRRRLLYAFEQLKAMPERPGPLFVLAHIAAPHPPFVFGPQGERVTPNREFMFSDGSHYMAEGSREEYLEGYRGQVAYVSAQVEPLLDAILASSARPAVIVLQADHGPGSGLSWYSAERTDLRERMSILNAYYLPGRDAGLYDSISPVNTFRLIFNEYFGAGYELLPDESYYSTWPNPYRFIPVGE